MDGAGIRQTFLKYFEDRGHTVERSSALIPRNDPTLFFTNAGMVQFKNVFVGEEKRDYVRATTVQKCLRVSGKHNDLENVGVTPRHHTFFEMLGNFSFGDYFKRDAIRYAWDLLTNVYRLDADKLVITIYQDDDEAFTLWREVAGVPEKKITRLGEKDNFWAMGDTGPCGPCTEIHLDKMAQAGKGPNPAGIIGDPEGYLEIWNLVFMQFERSQDGTLTPLPRPSIDTGMGLERLASILQGQQSNYDTDFFQPIIQRAAALAGLKYGADPAADISMRVIADHSRATAFLVADGVMPSNEERGYVLRRIMRRAIRHGVKLGLKESFLHRTVEQVIDLMGDVYPELRERRSYLLEVVSNEEQRFAETLDKGLRLYRDQADALKAKNQSVLPGEFAFRLSDTFGFPLDLTEIIASEDGLTVDSAGFDQEMAAQRDRARKAWKGSGEAAVAAVYQGLRNEGIGSEFVGYEHMAFTSRIRALLSGGRVVESVGEGDEVEVIVEQTPFYAESGGQIGDQGRIELLVEHADGVALEVTDHERKARPIEIEVTDTQSPVEGLIVHRGKVKAGTFKAGDWVRLEVDNTRRAPTRRNHTATHLLHAALRRILGTHVQQRGSLVAPDRLRFDFSHFKPVSPEELRKVEDWVNEAVLANVHLDISHRTLKEAMDSGVMALFGEKYGDRVRVINIPDLSAELCGGTHVGRTGDIGAFKIVSEGGIQAGVRRIEAVTGMGVIQLLRGQEASFREMGDLMKVGPGEVPKRLTKLVQERKDLEKQLEQLKRKLAEGGGAQQAATREVKGIQVTALQVELDDPKELRDQAARQRDKLGGVVALGAISGGKVSITVAVARDLTDRLSAGNIVKALAAIVEGTGGGKPDLAQAGGKAVDKLPEALAAVYGVVEGMV